MNNIVLTSCGFRDEKLLSENKYKVYALTDDDSLIIIDDKIIEYKGGNPCE